MNRLGKRLKAFVLCLIAGHSISAVNLRADDNLIGKKLSSVQQTSDLFTFFNFAQIGTENLPGQRTVVSFKPTGEAFRALVTLYVTTDGQGVIQLLRLVVVRSFIDDPKTCVYAADLAKSFLATAGTSGDDITALAREINTRAPMNSSLTLLTIQPRPTIPQQPSAAYETYSGKGPALTLSNQSTQASLQNRTQDDTPVLEITLALKS
jgi:hypothetical protein